MQIPAAVRFVSVEPMLGPIDLDDIKYHGQTIDWVICGGESGSKARPMHPDWVRSLRDQCKAAGVPFLFKQWGSWYPRDGKSNPIPKTPTIRLTDAGENGSVLGSAGGNDVWMEKRSKHLTGRTLDGVIHDGYPSQETLDSVEVEK